MSITHEFINPKSDDADDTVVRPSDWNADHVLSAMAGAGWTDWTPTVKAGSTTLSWSGMDAKYLDLGGIVFWYIDSGSCTGGGSGDITIQSLPTALQSASNNLIGGGEWEDSGSAHYAVRLQGGGSTWTFYKYDNYLPLNVTVGTSPADGFYVSGYIAKGSQTFDVPTLGTGIGCKLYHNTTQGSLAAATVNALSLNSEDSDPYGFHDPSTNNSRATVPAGLGGWYAIVGKAKVDQTHDIYIRKGGTTLLRGGNKQSAGEAHEVVVLAQLAAGEYVEVCEYHNTGTGTAGDASNDHLRTELSLVRIDSSAPAANPAGYEAQVYAGRPYTISDSMTGAGQTVGQVYIVPVRLVAPMALQSVSVRCTDTASARSWEWALYQDVGSANLTRVAVSNGSDAFTPSAASTRTLAASGAPVQLPAGVYWIAIRNNHGSNNFGLGFVIASSHFSGVTGNRFKTTTLSDPLDLSTGWSTTDNTPVVVLRGRIAGESTAY